ncbi:MAG: bifunctional glutamate N-acetyltransferase/amino-acid acetyltransferase ArgJ [bacterium]|nr:bifunctional glutamate N-acetyltransferase/amino-acid acetyltransferase ArgJ [bacterium]
MKGLLSVQGIKCGGIHCGIKKKNKDLALIYSETPCEWAGCFTTNRVKAASIIVNKKRLKDKVQAIVINSGIANSGTGQRGILDAKRMCQIASSCFNISEGSVLCASTGKIGEPLPMERIVKGIKRLAKKIDKGLSIDAASAIMTTDTKPKETEIDLGDCRLAGIAKGAGMIAPNMATMLSFIVTDAQIERDTLRSILKDVVNQTFNRITIDGDTSTNDMVALLANGLAGPPDLAKFKDGLFSVCACLARKIIEDAEGGTKVVRVVVSGAKSIIMAEKVAKAVANSNLTKSALWGQIPPAGRILCACGYSGARLNPKKIDIWLNQFLVVKDGAVIKFSESRVKSSLASSEIEIKIDLRAGKESVASLFSDLSPEYVRINAG